MTASFFGSGSASPLCSRSHDFFNVAGVYWNFLSACGNFAHVFAIVVALVIIVALAVALAGASIRVLREYERAVVFRLGRLIGQRGPGIVLLIPIIDRMVRVDLRTITFDIPPQDLITRDNVPAKVNAVAYFRVVDPVRSVVEVERHRAATSQIAQTTLRSVLGKADLDALLSQRERLNHELQQILDATVAAPDEIV